MAIPRFFKLPKHKKFNYQPLYYDPEKEERAERKREIEIELGVKREEGGNYKPTIRRGSMRNYYRKNNKVRRQSNVRLVIIFVVLVLLAYLILYA